MRHFHGLVFLGNGQFSVAEMERLKLRLDDGFNDLGAMQQGNVYATPEENERERAEITSALEDVVRDVAAALLGRKITFGEKLPYPPIEPV